MITTKIRWSMAAVMLAILSLGITLVPTQAQSESRLFPETGKTVRGRFLQYWNTHGGLPQQGFPLTEEFQEKSDTDGKMYTVQYFERAVFELHPELSAPNDVLLSLLGNFLYTQKYSQGAPAQTPNNAAGSQLFRETGKRAGGRFLQYWQRNGGLAQQGYPISDEFQERSATDGKTYTVQYFERAVFEYHPENAGKPSEVLLSLLGDFRLDTKYPSGPPQVTPAPAASPTPTLAPLTTAQRLQVFEEVWSTVRDNYVYTDFRGLNWQAVHDEYEPKIRGAANSAEVYRLIAEMIGKLDDNHSGFLDPNQAAEDDASRRGELKFAGIGIFSQSLDDGLRVLYVIPGGPASKAGLRAYDVIRAVNGTPLVNTEGAPSLIRGPAGTSVTLTVETPGKPRRDVTIVREIVNFTLHAEARRLPGTGIIYLNMPTFYVQGIAAEARAELDRVAKEGPVEGVIVDVRQNSGGLLVEQHSTLGIFINGGNAGYEQTRNGRTEDRIPSGRTLSSLLGKPVMVLISGGSESAAERFAAVMQDYKRATLIGTKTAGNSETVYPHDMPYGSRLSLAQAVYLRTDGKTAFEDIGVQPDVVMDVPWYEFAPEQDPQMLEAIKRIQGR